MSSAERGVPPLEAEFEAAARGADGTLFACSLCGCRFTHGGQVCGACPMSTGCELVKCPRCGFQFPRTSRIAETLSKLWKRIARRPS
jgi:hypothetical protein